MLVELKLLFPKYRLNEFAHFYCVPILHTEVANPGLYEDCLTDLADMLKKIQVPNHLDPLEEDLDEEDSEDDISKTVITKVTEVNRRSTRSVEDESTYSSVCDS